MEVPKISIKFPMASQVHHLLQLLLFMILMLAHHSEQWMDPSQSQALMKIKQQLNFPTELNGWSENADFCNTEPHPSLTLLCYEDNVTQLHVTGNEWFPNLPQDFSTASLFSSLASLPSLKVLSLVSLGLRGPLPSTIGNLSSLEILNISSNSFDGRIPVEIAALKSLQTLIMDHNSFSGQVPDWLGSLPLLAVLSLRNNSLNGSIPIELSSLASLRTIVLSGNNLSGEVPSFHDLTNLQVLDLEENNLGPHFPALPTKLASLVLRNNKFGFGISDELSSCYQLKKLDMSRNEFVGPFAPSLLSLPSLTYLDISGNKFTGKLLENMSCNAELTYVNLSFNRLTGDLPACLLPKSDSRIVLYSENCLSNRDQKQNPYPFCHGEALAVTVLPRKQKERRPYGKAVLASSMVGGIIGAIALLGLAFLLVKREKSKQHTAKSPQTRLILEKVSPGQTLKLLKDARYISETIKMGQLGILPYRTFVFDELKEATRNFDSSNVIGNHLHGQVYRGLLSDGTPVAIRSLKLSKKQSVQTYRQQLKLFSRIRHCHLVSAIGHCFECNQDDGSVSRIFLISEFVPNGTLRAFISEGQPAERFNWTQRIAAAISIARGIQFLHTGIVPGIFSNHLKITDILLDHDLHVKISRYNLPLLDENRKLDSSGASSKGSKDKSGQRSRWEEKTDVYDFGVILLEMIVGRAIISQEDADISKDILQVSLAADPVVRRNASDPAVQKDCSDDSLRTLIDLCLRCLSNDQSQCPSIEDTIWNLQFAAQVHESWQRDSYSSHGSPVLV